MTHQNPSPENPINPLQQPSSFDPEYFQTEWLPDGGLKIPTRALTDEEVDAAYACVKFNED